MSEAVLNRAPPSSARSLAVKIHTAIADYADEHTIAPIDLAMPRLQSGGQCFGSFVTKTTRILPTAGSRGMAGSIGVILLLSA